MQRSTLVRRYGIFFAGVLAAALGIALITKAGLGTSAVSSLAYVLTFVFPGGTLGLFTFLVNGAALAVQAAILGRSFGLAQLAQLPVTLVFSAGIDLWTFLLEPWFPGSYLESWAVLVLGCGALGLGVALEVLGDVLYLPCEGVVKVISRTWSLEFGRVKTLFDLGMVLSAAVVSLLCLGQVAGLREGTVFAAATVGGLSRWFRRKLEGRLFRTAEREDAGSVRV